MNKNTIGSEVAQILDVADIQTKYDAAARRLVAQKSVLAYILKSALDEFADIPVKRIAEEFIEGKPEISEVSVHQDHPMSGAMPRSRISRSKTRTRRGIRYRSAAYTMVRG